MKNLHLLRCLSLGFLLTLSMSTFAQSITEFHYDNASTDVNEFVEVTLPAGEPSACYTVYLINGSVNSNAEYDALTLDDTPSSAGCAAGTEDIYTIAAEGIQNGPDGIALVNTCTSTVIQFISYEDALTGSSFGGFTGQNSVDVGVAESTSGPTTGSIAFDGSTWVLADPATPGTPNDGSACAGGTTCSITGVMIMSAGCVGDDFDYEICATVANGSGDYSLIEFGSANPDIATASVPDGQVCFQVSIAGPTTLGSLDLDIVDTNDPTCAGGAPVTLTISDCPSTTTAADVYISELSYNPCGDQGADGDCEYIIITNDGTSVADISNYTISNAFTYTFPAATTIPVGGSLSLGISGDCTGLAPFDLSGGWTGGMTNTSETVELNDASGALVFAVTYNSSTGANGNCNAICIDATAMQSECASSLDGGGTCPDLTAAAPMAIIVNSVCGAGENTPSGGSIDPPTTDCPDLSTLQYSDDGGLSWSTQAPMYNQAGPSQTILTRCLCDSDMTSSSPETFATATVPGTCADCGAAITTFPANGN